MSHHHDHHAHVANTSTAFVVGIILNFLFVLVEFGAGLYSHSLALMSDAGHNLSDVAILGLSLFTLLISKRKANNKYTYGFQKSSILAALFNAIVLLVAVGVIGWEAVQRFYHPVESQGMIISVVAGIGILINTVSAFLFFREKEKDLNVKSAYLHLLVDALVSVGVVLGGILIAYTGITWLDPLISLIIMVIVIYSTWGLLTQSLELALDGVPEGIDVEKIQAKIVTIKGVKGIHHVHIWPMSTTKNAMTAHIVLDEKIQEAESINIKNAIRHTLEHYNIHHVTLELEKKDCSKDC